MILQAEFFRVYYPPVIATFSSNSIDADVLKHFHAKLTIDVGLPAVGHMEFAMTVVTHKVPTRALGRAVGKS